MFRLLEPGLIKGYFGAEQIGRIFTGLTSFTEKLTQEMPVDFHDDEFINAQLAVFFVDKQQFYFHSLGPALTNIYMLCQGNTVLAIPYEGYISHRSLPFQKNQNQVFFIFGGHTSQDDLNTYFSQGGKLENLAAYLNSANKDMCFKVFNCKAQGSGLFVIYKNEGRLMPGLLADWQEAIVETQILLATLPTKDKLDFEQALILGIGVEASGERLNALRKFNRFFKQLSGEEKTGLIVFLTKILDKQASFALHAALKNILFFTNPGDLDLKLQKLTCHDYFQDPENQVNQLILLVHKIFNQEANFLFRYFIENLIAYTFFTQESSLERIRENMLVLEDLLDFSPDWGALVINKMLEAIKISEDASLLVKDFGQDYCSTGIGLQLINGIKKIISVPRSLQNLPAFIFSNCQNRSFDEIHNLIQNVLSDSSDIYFNCLNQLRKLQKNITGQANQSSMQKLVSDWQFCLSISPIGLSQNLQALKIQLKKFSYTLHGGYFMWRNKGFVESFNKKLCAWINQQIDGLCKDDYDPKQVLFYRI